MFAPGRPWMAEPLSYLSAPDVGRWRMSSKSNAADVHMTTEYHDWHKYACQSGFAAKCAFCQRLRAKKWMFVCPLCCRQVCGEYVVTCACGALHTCTKCVASCSGCWQ